MSTTLDGGARFSAQIPSTGRTWYASSRRETCVLISRSRGSSAFFLTILAWHFDATQNAVNMPGPFEKKLQPDHPIGVFGLAAAVVRLLDLWFPSRCLPDRLLSARANLHIVRGPAHATVTRQGGKTHEGRLARHAAAEPLHGDQKHVFIDRRFSSRTKFFMERADHMARRTGSTQSSSPLKITWVASARLLRR